jgi:glycine cleavage system H protein
LSDIVFVELPEIGKEVKKGDIVCSVESVKAVSDIYSPLTGKIIEVNEELKSSPELINKSSYDEGWIFKLQLNDKDTSGLLTPEDYRKLIEQLEEGK